LNFLADESCDFKVVRVLRDAGHDCACSLRVRQEDGGPRSYESRRPDKDFGQLVYAHGIPSRSVILIRYPAPIRQRLCADIVKLVEQKEEALQGSFVVLEPGRVRIGRLPGDI
jgi:hypothetical protein